MPELVQVKTADGVRLDGALELPDATVARSVDALVCLHGTGGNFYGSSLFAGLSAHLSRWGAAVLRANTRGHDMVFATSVSGTPTLFGAAYELVDDCRHDLAAWIGFLRERGYKRLGLVGHSLGAIKTVFVLSREAPPGVVCGVAVSPPRLSYRRFLESERASDFLADYEAAQALVRQGQGRHLLEVRFPLSYLVTAEGYLDKYGPDERYNLLRFVHDVRLPLLVTFGGAELQSAAFTGLPEALLDSQERRPTLNVAIVADADHMYTSTAPDLAARIEAWLGQLAAAG